MKLDPRLFIAFLCTLVLAVAPSAGAAADTTPPKLNLPAAAGFVSGTTIGPMAPDADGFLRETDDISMNARWTASDASGICGSSYRRFYAGADPDPWSRWSSSMSLTYVTSDYEDQEGGGSFHVDGYDVRVKDCAQNITQKSFANGPAVYQENGSSYGYGDLTVTYQGVWGTSTCTCWSGGKDRKTTAAGARANFVFDSGGPVAVVMEKAANRGKAKVLVDGVLRATIDTYASTATHRSVVWTGTLTGAGHTVSVVNSATPGRPRIDVDAVMVN
ncbi:MAG: hypothetical protein ABIR34_03835 [Marmoricola sp.]